ncbi:hypothetical protein AQ740_18020 [Burkholderia pseudomallei]|nr:hypothetical protein AQ740_18020 [Burkholderia pseudomallei]
MDPANQAAGTVTSAWVPVQNFHTFLALIGTGAMGANGTLDAKIRQAQDASGTGAKDLQGKVITTIQAASGANVQALINFRNGDLDMNNGYAFVQVSLAIGTAASYVAAYLFGVGGRFDPPVDASAPIPVNLGDASVVQIV